MEANLRYGGADAAQIARIARAEDIDVVVLTELTPEELARLDAVGFTWRYPYHAGRARAVRDGTMAFSRYPLRDVRTVDVSRHGVVAEVESPRPYVHPLRTPSGLPVTVFRPWDHVWHKGITMALPNVGPDNFWGGATYTRKVGWYADLKNNGSQDHDEVLAIGSDDAGALFRHTLTWHRQPDEGRPVGEAVFTEVRTLMAALLPDHDAWVLGWRSELTNVSGSPIEMGSPTTEGRENAGYAGIFWRGPSSFTGGEIIGPSGPISDAARGQTGRWLAFVPPDRSAGQSQHATTSDRSPVNTSGRRATLDPSGWRSAP